MSIRSGKGDKGFTELYFKKRVSKDEAEVRAMGDLDELNSYIGLVKSRTKSRKDRALLEKIQHGISAIASEISVGMENKKKLGRILNGADAEWIDRIVREMERTAGVEHSFSLPGEGEGSAYLDIARAVARRAERSVVALFRKEKIKSDEIFTYLNCISDVFFIMARKKARGERRMRTKKKAKKKG